ncbi:MAG: DUF3179 domain-containing protein [Actinomycetia bacterium]|nr:DUF3179 domain-containing protein [Actinomycetes bacterium]MCP4084103.1 DUF3179 domain-containing protein [Actinomycetes bacterium]
MTIPPPARGWLFATLAGLSLTVAACSSARDTANPDEVISQDRAAADLTDGSTSLTPGQVVQPIQVPGDSRQGTISALSDPAHPDLPAPLVDLADIRSGGPPPDGIAPLDAPVFEQAIEVDWLAADEAVIVVDIGGDARAYPIQVLTWHEIVNDTFGDVPVTVTYCPLCNSAIVFDRRIDGQTFDFGTSGQLINSSLVMYDRQTESLWSHFTGQAIVGELTGLQLEFLPTSTVSWDDFRASHPKGLVLSRDTGFSRPYGQNPYAGYDNPDGDPFLFDGEVDPRLRAQTRVVAVRGEDATVAIVQDWLLDQGVAEVDLDGRALVVLLEPGVASALEQPEIGEGRDVGATGVFVPEGGGHELTFSPSPNGIGFMDDQTGSVWSILGEAVEGPLRGEQLEAVEHLDTFWFAIGAFETEIEIVGRPAV